MTRVPEPHLTALIPVRHYHRTYLDRAVRSVLGQSTPAWQLIIIDDGAGRELRQILASALSDPRVRVVRNEGRKLSGALNTGMRHATTEFTAILLGDDMWAPETVEVVGSSIERFPEIDFFHSARRYIDGDDSPISSIYSAKEGFTLESFVWSSPVKHLLCWRRELALSIGGVDETLNCVGPDDYDFPWSMAEAGARFMALPECLYLHRDHRDSFRLTTHIPLSVHVRELRRILRKHGVDDDRIEERIGRATATYLQQCLYTSQLDRWVKTLRRYEPRRGWREPYR